MTGPTTTIASELRRYGYRATPQRIAIYDALWKSGDHPTALDIHKYVAMRDPTISLGTVYNTLRLFADLGLVREMGLRDGSTRYDPRVDGHVNLICTRCGSVVDFHFDGVRGLKEAIRSKTDFTVHSDSVEVYGLCASCSRSVRGE